MSERGLVWNVCEALKCETWSCPLYPFKSCDWTVWNGRSLAWWPQQFVLYGLGQLRAGSFSLASIPTCVYM